jgi:nicotinate-nucleotide--dimethylbenzimidazole phosphoribosyltransferase
MRPPAADRHLADLIDAIPSLDQAAMRAARERLDHLAKPPGSLGRLEALVVQLAGIRGAIAPIDRPAIAILAADHGIARQGVSPYPSDVTRQMLATYAAGGAAINVLARAAGAELVVVDVGVAGPPLEPVRSGAGARLVIDRVREGTADFSTTSAMRRDEVLAAIAVGRRTAHALGAAGTDLLGVGEMGIANTTASSAIVAALTGRPASDVTGRGTGLDEDGVRHKAVVIAEALARHAPSPSDPVGVLAAVGGLEIAALVGAILAAARQRIPVVLDGFITGAAALLAARLAPPVVPFLIAGHRSAEPGHRVVLDELGLAPILELDLRLGEGTGAALAIPLVRAAARLAVDMATFDEAGVSHRS